MTTIDTAHPGAALDGALEEPTLCAAFQRTAAAHADAVALRSVDGSVELTWRAYADRVRRVAGGLAALGVERGATVGLLLTNRPEFNVVDTAAIHLGAVPFSIYATSAPEQIAYVLKDAAARIVVTESALLARLEAAALEHGVQLDHVVVVDGPGGTMSLSELEESDNDFDPAWRAVEPDDLLTLIYTSGTTGAPKGVELTHRNLLAAWRGMEAAWGMGACARSAISYLPSAHIADRFSSHYAAMLWGTTLTLCPDPRQVAAVLPQVRPTVFVGVPRVWEKVKAAVEGALSGGEEDSRMFAAVRERLGLDRCRVAVSAGAPIPVEVLEFLHAIGIPVLEVYGLSETCAVTTANPIERPKLGTVGRAIPGVELRLLDDGELLVRGETVMRGYRNRPAETSQAIDNDGWLHTGDVAEIDDEGYVRIIDRKKELIINAAGKNMSPANIEATVKTASPLIGHVCCIGDRRPYNVALLTVDPEAAAAFAANEGLEPDPRTPALDPRVLAAVADAIERANERLSRPEQIKRHLVLDHDWLPGGAQLTPTMKLRRRAIAERYAAEIERLYG